MEQQSLQTYVEQNYNTLLELLRSLCRIPAPSHHEKARADFCQNWLEQAGATGVYVDSALNVIFPLNCENDNQLTVFAAHTDTVFPDLEPLPYREDDNYIYCPGVGDDTASLAILLMTAKYFIEYHMIPSHGILFVCNSAEEGLGNLKGTRQLMWDYEGRISRFITFDSNLNYINHQCVGSHRYRVEVKTEGGHSFQKFGNPNAIAILSELVHQIYALSVPSIENARTSYNVGTIEGGTSVNTIAQNASMLCEYRSDNEQALSIMKENFEKIFSSIQRDGIAVLVEQIGSRPCAKNVDPLEIEKMTKDCIHIIEEITGQPVTLKSASTDCNIPLSLGIPAICVGVYRGAGAHTREEWIEKSSLKPGFEIALKIVKFYSSIS